ncbi:hypothetical protein [Rathayibacter sp. VKM Ac-2760]|uniref:hypothetical protein n=1 Tax=Rathayibacter sp. VKM Ac-2760 TaxID=2609253 RepID=UPI001ABEE584|nr:hypothetical protein [Rathayibacter sp. VKM Ac-2760]
MARTAVSAARQLFSRSRRGDAPGEGEPPYGVEPDVTEYLPAPPATDVEATPGTVLRGHAAAATAGSAHVFDVAAPAIGEYCELDADALEFPHPGVASFVPDLSRPARGAGAPSSFRSPPPPAPPAAPSPMIDLPRDLTPSEPQPDAQPDAQSVDAQFFDAPAPVLTAPPVAGPSAPPLTAPSRFEPPIDAPRADDAQPVDAQFFDAPPTAPSAVEPPSEEAPVEEAPVEQPPAAAQAEPDLSQLPAPQPVDALIVDAPPAPPAPPVVDPDLLRGFAQAPAAVAGLAPVIGELCELDPDRIEFPHPHAADFVPVQGRSRGAFGLLLPEPVRRSEPARPAEPEQYTEQYTEPAQYTQPERSTWPEHDDAADVAPDLFDERFLAPAPFPGESDDDAADRFPAPVPASAHQWHGAPVSAEPLSDDRSDDDRSADERAPRSHRRVLLIGAGVGVALLLIGGALIAVPLLTAGDGGGDSGPVAAAAPGTTEAAVSWVADTLDPESVLLVQDDLVADVTGAGFPSDTVVSESTLTAAAPDSAWRAADYILSTPALRATATGETETALDNSEAVASFGSGDSAVEVRRVLDEGADQAAAAATVLTAARASAGGQLAANPALTTTDAARTLLESGQVDSRLLLLLGQQLAFTPLSVADFPVGSNEVDGVRHRMILSGYNGAGLPADAAATQNATTWLGSQSGDFVPMSVESIPEGLLVTLDLDEPSGLLPGTQ